MELLGFSIQHLLDRTKHKKFSLSTSIQLAVHQLISIKNLHKSGFVHRNIKPSNFLTRNSKKYPIVLIDFGLSISISELSLSNSSDFVGSLVFSSLNVHEGKPFGFNDDLYSWFLVLLYQLGIKFPWRRKLTKEKCHKKKKQFDFEQCCKEFPKQIG
jgi:serine/threonine protein kinase